MNEQQTLRILTEVGAVITNSHIVYTSNRHGATYVNKDAIYPHTAQTSRLRHAMAERFADDNVEIVIAPAIGGVILSQWTAHHLSEITGREVFGVYAEKEVLAIPSPKRKNRLCYAETGNFVIKRGYDEIVAEKNILVVEDVLTTGGSAKKVIETVRALGGNVIGLGVLCNRGGITAQDVGNVPKLTALANMKLDAWDEADCPLCAKGIPVNPDVGKGKEYLARKK